MVEKLVTRSYSSYLFALAGVLLALPAAWTGWQQDDLNIRYFLLGYPGLDGKPVAPLDIFAFLTGDPQRARQLMDIGLVPWWTLENMRLSFWRPLSAATHWIDYALWPDSATLMHIQSLIWFGAVIVIAAILYKRFLGVTLAAGLAALFFAVDDAHGLPAGWLANRNALIATLFGLLVLFFHDRWRREKWNAGAFLSPALLLLGLLSGEFALGVLGYLVAYEMVLDRGSWRQRFLRFLPYAVVASLWLVAYSMLGYGTWGSGFYVSPLSEPLAYVRAFFTRAPLLLADQLAIPPTTLVLFLPSLMVTALLVWAVVLLSALFLAMLPLLRRDRTARFWALGMVLCLPPVCATMPHSRVLLFAGLGGMGLVAQWIVGFRGEAGWSPGVLSWRRFGQITLILLIVVHGIVAPLLLPFNAISAVTAEPFIQTAASSAPVGPELSGQDLIIVNPPNAFFAHYFSTARVVLHLNSPRHLRVLAPGAVALHVHRADERTLVVRPERGYLAYPFDNVFRNSRYPLKLNDKILLTNMVVEITALTQDGRPEEAAFRFERPLEDPSFAWLAWKDGRYEPFCLPPSGGDVTLPAQLLF
jgi:hypothetical protein